MRYLPVSLKSAARQTAELPSQYFGVPPVAFHQEGPCQT